MGLGVALLGVEEVPEALADTAFGLLVDFVRTNFPEEVDREVGAVSAALRSGHWAGEIGDLHALRGLALLLERGADRFSDVPGDEPGAAAEAYYFDESRTSARFLHLVEHPEDEGFYLPFEIGDPLLIEAELEGLEEMVAVATGSSVALLRELDDLNSALGMPGDLLDLGAEAFEEVVDSHRWPGAARVWGVLRAYARESVERFEFMAFCRRDG